MSSQHEREYYRRRAAQERAAAARADHADHMVAKLHLELAQRYALLAADYDSGELEATSATLAVALQI